jgi:hypothetical protein
LHFLRNRQERGGVRGLEMSRRGDMTPLWDPGWNPMWDAVAASGLPVRVHTIAASPGCFCSYLQRSHRSASPSRPAPASDASRRLRQQLGAGRPEGGFWCISLMRRSELTNVRIARDDHQENEQDRLLPCFFVEREGGGAGREALRRLKE